jgi:HicB family
MPRTLHAELAQAAEREGTSLNQLIVGMLSRSVGVPVDEPGSEGAAAVVDAEPETEADAPSPRQSRVLTYALAVNLVVLLVAGAIAVALLIVAWHGGF